MSAYAYRYVDMLASPFGLVFYNFLIMPRPRRVGHYAMMTVVSLSVCLSLYL